MIQGDVQLERSLYVEDINVDLLELIQGLFQRQRLELAETDTFQTTTQLNIGISGPHDALHVRNNVANLQGDVRLGRPRHPGPAGHLRRRHHRSRRHPGLQRQRVPGAARGAHASATPTGSIR